MCNYMRTTILTLIVILFSNCTRDNAELGDSYYYLDNIEAIDIGYPDGAIIYKSKSKLQFDTVIISKEVVHATHNDNFIIAKQLATTNRLDTSYYIIDKNIGKVYGPLTADSCETLKITLRIGI